MNPIDPSMNPIYNDPGQKPEPVKQANLNPLDPSVQDIHHHGGGGHLKSGEIQAIQSTQHKKSWKSHFNHLRNPIDASQKVFVKKEKKQVSKSDKKDSAKTRGEKEDQQKQQGEDQPDQK